METQVLDNDMLNNNNEGKSLQQIIANGYETHSVEYIKKGFEIFKQEIGGFIGFLIVIGIASGVLSMIPFVGKLANMFITPLSVGAFIVAKMIDKNEAHSFSNFFDGTKDYKELIIVSVIQFVIIYVLMFFALGKDGFLISMGWKKLDMTDLSGMMSAYSGMGRRYGIISIPMLVISVMWIFSYFFVVFPKFKAWDAMEASRKVVFKKFFNWLGFGFLLVLFNMAGAICLVIGLLVTIPSSICAVYVAFEDVIGVNVKP